MSADTNAKLVERLRSIVNRYVDAPPDVVERVRANCAEELVTAFFTPYEPSDEEIARAMMEDEGYHISYSRTWYENCLAAVVAVKVARVRAEKKETNESS